MQRNKFDFHKNRLHVQKWKGSEVGREGKERTERTL
jgi:hypothetical protein